MRKQKHRVIVVGGGFGGLCAVQALKKADVHVTLLDRRNFHLFQPLLYQVATGTLSAANIAASLRSTLNDQPNAEVLLGEMTGIDVKQRQVVLKDRSLPYDTLIVATGSEPSYFGHDDWRTEASGLKTVEDAITIRSRILRAFEEAEREKDPARVQDWLTFVIAGAGPTGVELAGALCEVAHKTLARDFRHIDSHTSRIFLINSREHVLPEYPVDLSLKAEKSLRGLGVTIRNNCRVTEIQPGYVVLNQPPNEERIKTRTVLWAAGVRASSLGQIIGEATGAAVDKAGRVAVAPDCSVPGHPDVFVIGDLAALQQNNAPLPGIAPVAMQEGRYVADVIKQRLKQKPYPTFRYRHKGNVATIGRNRAVADLGWIKFDGLIAWLIWALVHLLSLVEFEDRLQVALQWFWNYLSWNRSNLLITYTQPPEGDATEHTKGK